MVMKKHPKRYFIETLLLTAVLVVFIAPSAVAQEHKTASTPGAYPPVIVPNTEMRSIHSEILDRQMSIYVKLPAAYYKNPEKVYPVWYVTDANRSFPMLANMVSIFDVPFPTLPEIVLIGIGYEIGDMADFAAWRTRDLTPVNEPWADENVGKWLSEMTGRETVVRSGGGPIFLRFITDELFPFVESDYRVSSGDRCLGGISYGGLFTLYVMFEKPELFTKYFAGSPTIGYANGYLFKAEAEYAATHDDLNARLFMTMGALEDSVMISNMHRMTDQLRSRKYPGFTIMTHVFPDEWHQSCGAPAMMRALVVLNKK
ncbi:MAG: alpha/beta hydrolase [Bacteroidales bacterium]|nr:alpha/beta hydrolase [Bacteroidales bacterium]